jgi:hypothetical protein
MLFILVCALLLRQGQGALAQTPRDFPPNELVGAQSVSSNSFELPTLQVQAQSAPVPVAAQSTLPTPAPPAAADTPANPDLQQLNTLQDNVRKLREQQAAVLGGGAKDVQQKQIEVLQKQIEVQQKMIELMVEQLRKQAALASAVEQLQTTTATLEARGLQAARRDQELANGVTNLTEQQDAAQRNGSWLPAQLRQLFLPSGTNESPLSIYGALAVGYSSIQHQPSGFYFGEFTPDFLLKLNDWIFLSAEIGIGSDGSVSAGSFAEADFFVNDWLTVSAGRFVAPIGTYNLRLNNPWINKLPGDAPGSGPLLWQQVLPPVSLLGLQASGAFYLGRSPLKLEYNAYVSNGLNVTPGMPPNPNINELANLENMTNTFNIITNDKAMGGRVGLWYPEMGVSGGLSGLYNGDYVAGGFENNFYLCALDLNYHRGNWDARFEYGMSFQQTSGFIGNNIRREGLHTQIAYRPWDLPPGPLQKTELVYRFGYVDFHGIDPAAIDVTTFSTLVDVPIRRSQHEFGINYYFYPRMVIKFAYQLNDEVRFHLHDSQFLTELAWGW